MPGTGSRSPTAMTRKARAPAQRYDAFKLTKDDGKGKWWDGLDPQELYAGAVMPMPDGITSDQGRQRLPRKPMTGSGTKTPPLANPAFVRHVVPALQGPDRQLSARPALFRQYRPAARPGRAGHRRPLLQQLASPGTASCSRAELQGAAGGPPAPRWSRTSSAASAPTVVPHPWQTDTCIGDWHYNRERFLDKSYMPRRGGHASAVRCGGQEWLPAARPFRCAATAPSTKKSARSSEGVASWTGRYGEAIFATPALASFPARARPRWRREI